MAVLVSIVIFGGAGGGDMGDAPGKGLLLLSPLGRGFRADLTESGTPSGVGSFSFLSATPGSEVLLGDGDCPPRASDNRFLSLTLRVTMLLLRRWPFSVGCGVSVLGLFAAGFSSPEGRGRLTVGGGVLAGGFGWLKLSCRGAGVTMLAAGDATEDVEIDGRGVPELEVLILIEPALTGATGRGGSATTAAGAGAGGGGAMGSLGLSL